MTDPQIKGTQFSRRIGRRAGVVFVIGALSISCSQLTIDSDPTPSISIPNGYAEEKQHLASEQALDQPWWEAYRDHDLNKLIEKALSSNFSLRTAWSRLRQSEAVAAGLEADKYPSIDFSGSALHSSNHDAEAKETSTSRSFGAGASLSFEIDLWRRKDTLARKGHSDVEESRADYENTALLLSGQVAELWIRAREQKALLKLLEEQVKVGQTLLDLTELRFKVGQGSAVDVYSQRQQLESTKAEIPVAESNLKQISIQLAILSGRAPAIVSEIAIPNFLPNLPDAPSVVSPAELLTCRPDLRAVKARLRGTEYELAAAMADRLPRIGIALSYDFTASYLADLFKGFVTDALSNIAMPLFDAGRRQATVEKSKAAVEEVQDLYSHTFLTALQDIEIALVAERYQLKLIDNLKKQLELARANLNESKARYLNGISDYLHVTLAVQSQQELERRLLNEQRELLLTRNRLYIALGGEWTERLPNLGWEHGG